MFQQYLSEHSDTILWLASISFGVFVISILALPLIIVRLPVDFFIHPSSVPVRLSPLRLALKILKNALGLFLLLIGTVMLFTPGQGILTILLGISLMDFPGKHRLQGRIVRSPRVHRSLNWLRQRAGRSKFALPEK
jgi:hypothetical protein